MAIESLCSGCGQKLAVADENAGKRARCPSCGHIYIVPTPASASTNPALQETSAGAHGDVDGLFGGAEQESAQFWMQTGDGQEYGPVNRPDLNRWFSEGRVGPDYQIREGESGTWQPANNFRPQPAPSNPYGQQGFRPSAGPMMGQFQKSDPSGLVLTLGIVAWVCVLACWPISWIPGIVAVICGRSALKDIQKGIADPTNVSLVQVGYYLGLAQVILALLIVIGILGFFAVAIVADSM